MWTFIVLDTNFCSYKVLFIKFFVDLWSFYHFTHRRADLMEVSVGPPCWHKAQPHGQWQFASCNSQRKQMSSFVDIDFDVNNPLLAWDVLTKELGGLAQTLASLTQGLNLARIRWEGHSMLWVSTGDRSVVKSWNNNYLTQPHDSKHLLVPSGHAWIVTYPFNLYFEAIKIATCRVYRKTIKLITEFVLNRAMTMSKN